MLPLQAPIWGVSPTPPDVVDALGTDGGTVVDSAVSILGAVGANNANNAFASNLVVANADGSALERLEYLQSLQNAQPRSVAKTDGAVINAGGGDPIFVISGGPVRCKISGLVTTVIGGAANMSITEDTAVPAATVNLSAAPVAIDADAAGTLYRNVGATSIFTPSTGLGFAIIDPVTVEEVDFILTPGTVKALASAPQTGVIAWYCTYWPLSPSSVVTAAA
jgi:hypothetical protein